MPEMRDFRDRHGVAGAASVCVGMGDYTAQFVGALRCRSERKQSPLLLLREADLLKCIWEYEAYLAEGQQRE